ncbi:hypothetical protein LEP1GSC172_1068 [Leptospira noguchii]|uniref:Uncharacterized protein n=1 Tax=Leptospira noguchii TaxID=28182 RepID=M6VBT5_9LEPT|nr:hypothetical protein LEP1GSC172_1068 [Leptospira noguchii]
MRVFKFIDLALIFCGEQKINSNPMSHLRKKNRKFQLSLSELQQL